MIFDVNRSRTGVGFCNFGAGLESESQKSDPGHLWFAYSYPVISSRASTMWKHREIQICLRIRRFGSLEHSKILENLKKWQIMEAKIFCFP